MCAQLSQLRRIRIFCGFEFTLAMLRKVADVTTTFHFGALQSQARPTVGHLYGKVLIFHRKKALANVLVAMD
ncbi:hypothetical protein B8W72_27755 [Pseudomonas putida]|uniref:Uncharacterized protein n=1 Tax=Pseudomonas putida TaxID=303 RepID=A0A1Y3KD55_PSEPU|nr:hypothetical protein B8W72_27755 [Pseudomonas putida]